MRGIIGAGLAALLLAWGGRAAAQPARPGAELVWWDVERLYDTLPSPFGRDAAYLPDSPRRWTGVRYARKVRQVAARLDELGAPLAALYGVENEGVVRDVAAACAEGYAYVHRTTDSYSGLDFALLYHGDRFIVEEVRSGYYWMSVLGRLDGRRLVLLFTSSDRHAEYIAGELRALYFGVPMVAAGRSAQLRAERLGLRDATAAARRAGRGDVRRRGGWTMRSRILCDTCLDGARAEVYLRADLLDARDGAPRPTYRGEEYRGGVSENLPLRLRFAPEDLE